MLIMPYGENFAIGRPKLIATFYYLVGEHWFRVCPGLGGGFVCPQTAWQAELAGLLRETFASPVEVSQFIVMHWSVRDRFIRP